MFTGIIEEVGVVAKTYSEGKNQIFLIESAISSELNIDQSVAHDGACLTVTAVAGSQHTVVAVAETLAKTNLSEWRAGRKINLERAMKLGDRLDGHLVQGHVDATGTCTEIEDAQGSTLLTFRYDRSFRHLLISKGSITVNGISLTLVNPSEEEFSVAIIPYTLEHTNLKDIRSGDLVNLEFDMVGKYIRRSLDGFVPDLVK